MDFFLFNKDHGYLEGLIRGLNNSLMTRTDYGNLAQAETLEELKIALQATHYQKQLMNVSEKMSIHQLEEILQERYYKEFRYIRTNALEPLCTFLDYLTYGYMIDNIALLISGILHGRPLTELLLRCHPLGKFEHISAISVCSSPAELYNAILVDTPLAKFFEACVSEQDFDETHVVIIRNYVYREYLECFNKFILSIGGITEAMMRPILQFECDRRAFIITMNSLGTDLNKEDRLKFFNTFGLLDHTSLVKLAKADDFEQIKQIASAFDQYAGIFASIDFQNQTKSIEDGFFEQEVKIHNSTFDYQFNFAIFYSYFRLMEQQIRNIIWVGECISQKNKSRIDQYLKVYP